MMAFMVIRNFTPGDFAPVISSPPTTCNGGEVVRGEFVLGVKLFGGEIYGGEVVGGEIYGSEVFGG